MSRKELTKDKDMACKIILVRMPNSGVSGNTKLEGRLGLLPGGGESLTAPLPLLLCQAGRRTDRVMEAASGQ